MLKRETVTGDSQMKIKMAKRNTVILNLNNSKCYYTLYYNIS